MTGEGGTGEDIHGGFEACFKKLGDEVTKSILVGVTDTPSANRKAWRLLEASHPKQFWIGCAAHEVNLLFKEWVSKTDSILRLYRQAHRIVKHVKNHGELLKQFRELVPKHFQDRRKHSLTLYSPGGTRMLTVFKMIHRILAIKEVLVDWVSRPEYDTSSQKVLKQWSAQRSVENRLTPIDGK